MSIAGATLTAWFCVGEFASRQQLDLTAFNLMHHDKFRTRLYLTFLVISPLLYISNIYVQHPHKPLCLLSASTRCGSLLNAELDPLNVSGSTSTSKAKANV